MDRIQLRALAKINLGLDVLKKREDGYHEVRMVMQTINMYDRITLTKTVNPNITVSTNLHYLPNNENNLGYKAAALLQDRYAIKQGVHIDIAKFIPVAAGMAGGSSDAAAVLFGMNRIFDLGIPRDKLMEIGVKIGADVPYCLMRGTALAEGIGDKLTRIAACPGCYILMAKPGISVSTKFVYENLRVDELEQHPDIDGILAAIRARDIYAMAKCMGNVLETVTIPHYPVIAEIKAIMMEYGALGSIMSGSGPTVFGVFADQETGEAAKQALWKRHITQVVYLTEVV